VTLETPSWGGESDGIRRLRAMLKRLGRGYGLRCVDVRPADKSGMPNPDGQYFNSNGAVSNAVNQRG
jgi:hypothetical protein